MTIYPFVEEVVLDTSRSDTIPDTLHDVIIFLQEKLSKIPLDYKRTATFDVDACSYWDSHHGFVRIYYERPMNKEELVLASKDETKSLEAQIRFAKENLKSLQKSLTERTGI